MKQRSAAYPSYTITESLDFVEKVYRNYGNSYRALREEIAKALNYSVGSLTQKVSAAVQYGFLDMKSKEGYKVTDLFVSLFRPISDDSEELSLLEAFKNPPLYAELIEAFEGNILPQVKPLANILLNKHNISNKACDKAADIFVENALLVGAINHDRILTSTSNEEVEAEIVDIIPEKANSNIVVEQEGNQSIEYLETNAIPHNIPLKGKKPAQLLLPNDVGSSDFDFIIAYIGLIRQQYT